MEIMRPPGRIEMTGIVRAKDPDSRGIYQLLAAVAVN